MAFENLDVDNDDTSPEFEEEAVAASGAESSNRTFIIVASIIGGLVVLSLVCLGIFLLTRGTSKTKLSEKNRIETQNAMIEQTRVASAWTATPTIKPTQSPVTDTPKPTNTAVINRPSPTVPQANAATVEALKLTQAAQKAALATVTPTPNKALPKGGFAEDIGLTGLIGVAVVLIIVVFVARRLRSATAA